MRPSGVSTASIEVSVGLSVPRPLQFHILFAARTKTCLRLCLLIEMTILAATNTIVVFGATGSHTMFFCD